MITTLTGTNSYLLQNKLQQTIDAFVKDNGDFGLERLDGEDASYEQMLGSLESLPFLSSKKLVVLRNPSANKQFVENFETVLERINETTDVIIVETKLDKRLSYYKLLKKSTEFQEFNELDARELPNWLVDYAKQQKGSLSTSDARFLVERIGPNQQLLYNEIQKLLDYDSTVTRESIELLTEQSPQSSVFQLIDVVFAGNIKRAIELYSEQRRQNIEPQAIMGMLAWQLHVLAIVKMAGNKSSGEIAKEAKLNPYVVQKSQNIARKLSVTELKALVRRVANLDEKLKTTALDADDAIQQLLFDITELLRH